MDSKDVRVFSCGICYEDCDDDTIVRQLSCGHAFCGDCFGDYYESLIAEQNKASKLCCPEQGCEVVPTDEEVASIVTPELFKKF